MLVSAKKLKSARVAAIDGKGGKVKTFLFDDESWAVRFLVVKRGFWFFGRDVLVSPMSVTAALQSVDHIQTNIRTEQLDDAPSADIAKPISRRMEEQFHNYYRIPVYWGGIGLWAGAMTPMEAGAMGYDEKSKLEISEDIESEHHLRSTEEVIGYEVTAMGEKLGQVADMLIEDNTWAIRYLRVAAPREYGDGLIYVAPDWVEDVSWLHESMALDLEPEVIRGAPRVGHSHTLQRHEEVELYDYYKRPRYWNV